MGGQDETVLENAGAEESVADDAVNWVSVTQDHKDTFVQTLSPISAALAELLYKVWGGEYDEELTVLAGQSLQGPSKPWYKYLEAPDGGDEEERSSLQEQWDLYQTALMSKPKAICELAVQADAADPTETNAQDDDAVKQNLQKTICDLRKKKVTFIAAAGATYAQSLVKAFDASPTGRNWKKGKDHVRAFLLSADLFPEHAKKFTKSTHTGMLGSVADEFVTAIKFLVEKKETDDILIVFNGRSRLAEGKIVGTSELYAHKGRARNVDHL